MMLIKKLRVRKHRFFERLSREIEEKGSIPDLENYSKQVNFDKEKILNQLIDLSIEERQTLFTAVCIAVVVDGKSMIQNWPLSGR